MKRIISVLVVLCMVVGLVSFSALSTNAEITYDYKNEFELAFDYEGYYYNYEEYYKYYAETNDTDTPDWVFGRGFLSAEPSPCQGTFGDYVFYSGGLCEPYNLGYFVYIPSENKFYDIIKAWDLGFENLELAFKECVKNEYYGIGFIGDADLDGELSVLDATFIQRALANQCDFLATDDVRGRCLYGEPLWYLSDFNRDGKRTILDATAIQMKLAKIDTE